MKYSKEKKEKIKKGATATVGVLLAISASIGATLGVINAVQGAKTETITMVEVEKEIKVWDTKEVEKLNKNNNYLQLEQDKLFNLIGFLIEINTVQQKEIEKLEKNILSAPTKKIANYIRLRNKKIKGLEANLKSAGERIGKLLPRGLPVKEIKNNGKS